MPEERSSLWFPPELTPPGPVGKLGKHDLARWQKTLQTALSRHRYLMSQAGQQMIQLSIQQSIARLRQELSEFDDWIGNHAESGLKKLEKLQKQLQDEIDRRNAPKAEAPSAKEPGKRIASLVAELSADPEISAAIVKKHGSVEKYAQSLTGRST